MSSTTKVLPGFALRKAPNDGVRLIASIAIATPGLDSVSDSSQFRLSSGRGGCRLRGSGVTVGGTGVRSKTGPQCCRCVGQTLKNNLVAVAADEYANATLVQAHGCLRHLGAVGKQRDVIAVSLCGQLVRRIVGMDCRRWGPGTRSTQ